MPSVRPAARTSSGARQERFAYHRQDTTSTEEQGQ